MLIPRDYQTRAVEAVRAQYAAGLRSTLLVLATGLGKTVIAAIIGQLTSARAGRLLFVAHRRELLAQALRKFHEAGVRATLEQGTSHADPTAPVVVASVDTLRGPRLEQLVRLGGFAVVVVDEAHRACAASYRALWGAFPSARFLGLTATPERLDGQALGDMFDSVAFEYGLRAAIRDQRLVPLRARRVVLESVDLSAVRVVSGDLDPRAMAALLETERALHGAAVPLLRETAGRRTVAFCASTHHADELARVLNQYEPGVATSVHGKLKTAEREARLVAHRAGRVRIVTNCDLLTEGYDDPAISAVAMLRPTKSNRVYTQQVGRGTRLSPETGKTDLLILDLTPARTGAHRLAGPADALAGRFVPPEVAALLDAVLLEGLADVEDALATATEQAEAEGRAEAERAIARYRVEELDPWLPTASTHTEDTSGEAATEKQLAALKKLGIPPPPNATAAGAARILAAHATRLSAGLCSVRAAKALVRGGLPAGAARTLTAAEAKPMLTALQRTGWRYVPRALLAKFLTTTTTPSVSPAAERAA